ncbi:MAG: hypothetical protein CL878_06220 [Dehalococcoidia bacterium]|nr:hypothetical protein [Dehalococcoidia bacterium]
MVSSGPAIEAQGLARRYGRIVALRPLSISVRPGERVGVVGPNGAGKSTLLRLIGRQLRPTHGSLFLFGRPVGRTDLDTLAEIGYVGHQPWLYDELTPLENLTFFQRLYGLSQDMSGVAAAVERVGLGSAARTPVSKLSRGQQQRCALARATLHRPPLLLLDEPDASLDPLAIADLAALLGVDPRHPQPEGGWNPAVLLATHDLDLALTFCQRLLVLVEGRYVLDAPTGALTAAGLRALYTGEEAGGPLPSSFARSAGAGGTITPPEQTPGEGQSEGQSAVSRRTLGGRKPQGEAHSSPRPTIWASLTAIIGKDLRIEGRRRDNVAAAAMYAIICLLIFNFALDAPGTNPARLVPGLIWVTITYGATVGFGRTFAQEHERGNLDALLAAPLDRSVLYAAKLLGNLALTAVLIALTVPLAAVFFNVAFAPHALLLSLALGTIGLAAVGTLLSAMAAQTRAREVLLPVLLFPISVPALLAAVHSTAAALQGRMAWGGDGDAPWLHLLIAFDLLYVVLSWLVFEFALEE